MYRALRPLSSLAPARAKVSASDSTGILSSLSVKVPHAGSRHGPAGYSHVLSNYAFLNNSHKSALRLTRESELLGGVFSATPHRDYLLLTASFLKSDLPYYVNMLANVCAHTSFRAHELVETVLPAARAQFSNAYSSNAFVALEEAHAASFRRGLGQPLYYNGVAQVSPESIAEFAHAAFNSDSLHISATGVNESDLQQFVAESAFSALEGTSAASTPAAAPITGTQTRISAGGENSAVIAVPISPKDFDAYEKLAVAVGSKTVPCPELPLAKIPGAHAHLYQYADAGLFVVQVSGTPLAVSKGIPLAKRLVEQAASQSLEKHASNAALAAALAGQTAAPKSTAKPSLDKFNYVAIGDLDVLPYAEEL